MGRAGHARVIGTDQHFHFLTQGVFAFTHELRDELVEVGLDVSVVLVGRDAAVAPDAFAVFVKLIRVEQDAAGCFDRCVTATGLGCNHNLFRLGACCDQLVDDFDRSFNDMGRFDQLADIVHIWIDIIDGHAEHLFNYFSQRTQELGLIFVASDRSGEVRITMPLGPLSGGLRRDIFVGNAFPFVDGHVAVTVAVGAGNVAVVERVFAQRTFIGRMCLLERNIFGIPLKCRQVFSHA